MVFKNLQDTIVSPSYKTLRIKLLNVRAFSNVRKTSKRSNPKSLGYLKMMLIPSSSMLPLSI